LLDLRRHQPQLLLLLRLRHAISSAPRDRDAPGAEGRWQPRRPERSQSLLLRRLQDGVGD